MDIAFDRLYLNDLRKEQELLCFQNEDFGSTSHNILIICHRNRRVTYRTLGLLLEAHERTPKECAQKHLQSVARLRKTAKRRQTSNVLVVIKIVNINVS